MLVPSLFYLIFCARYLWHVSPWMPVATTSASEVPARRTPLSAKARPFRSSSFASVEDGEMGRNPYGTYNPELQDYVYLNMGMPPEGQLLATKGAETRGKLGQHQCSRCRQEPNWANREFGNAN
eukprot:g11444.t1